MTLILFRNKENSDIDVVASLEEFFAVNKQNKLWPFGFW